MKNILGIAGIIILLLAACLLLPWEYINWGKITILPAPTITVTGEARADEMPQVAHFSASVSIFNETKQIAVNEVNSKMNQLIKDLKTFGIDSKDIQTQQISVFEINNEPEIMMYPSRPRAQSKGWQAANSITITLRNIDKASGLTNLLESSGATDVSGPSFSLDDTAQIQTDLLAKAIANAREKAEKAAIAGGRKLGKMITVSEGYSYNPRPMYALGGAKMDTAVSAPVEPGTERLSQTATVVFELK